MDKRPFPEPTKDELRKGAEVARVVRGTALGMATLLACGAGALWLLAMGYVRDDAPGWLAVLAIGGIAIVAAGMWAMRAGASPGVLVAIAIGLVVLTFGVCSTMP